MKSVLLLSGGLDSTALAALHQPDFALTLDYGQKSAAGELRAAIAVATHLHLHHEILTIDCSTIGSGDLAGSGALPAAPASDWWPYRNQLLITLAASRAIVLGANELLIGTVRGDSAHADGRPTFIAALDSLLRMQEGSLGLRAPAIAMSTVELVRATHLDSAFFAWAHSCHKAPWTCGQCRGCYKRAEVWHEMNW